MESTKDRLVKFLQYLGIGQSKFGEICGISGGIISASKGSFTMRTLGKIYQAYPDLNPDWLEHGKGTMLKSEQKASQPAVDSSAVIASLQQTIALQQQLLASQQQTIEQQQHTIAAMQERINDLTDRLLSQQTAPHTDHSVSTL